MTSRHVQRRPGDNKSKLDFEDTANLWCQLDEAKTAFPTYVAADLKRVPRLDPSEADIFALATNLASLHL